MKKTPKILPTFYKSKGTPIFRDTTALPFAKGGPIEDQPVNPPAGPSWVRPQLSPERIAALKELHGDSVFANADPNDLLLYELNKDIIDSAKSFGQFLDPSVKTSSNFNDERVTKDLKTRLTKAQYALDTKTGNYLRVPDEIYKELTFKEEPLAKLEPLVPDLIDRTPLQLQQRPAPVLPEYTKAPYHIDMPTITMAHHHSGQLIPHARPQIHSTRVPGLVPSIVQKLTGYDKAYMEGTYDEEGNYIPGEIENAQQQNRPINFVGASSLRDLKAQKEYQGNLPKNIFSNGGTIKFVPSEYGSDPREQYADGGNMECPPGYVNVNGTCVPVTPTERGPVEQDSADFLTKMANSPLFAERYNAMIGATAKPEEIEAYRQSVLNNINNVAFWPLGKEADNSNWAPNADYIGYYSGVGNADTDKFGLSQLPQDLNNPNRYDLGNQEHVIFRNFASPTSTTHEFSHASTLGDRIPATVKIPFSKDPAKKEYVKWFSQDDFSNQTENKAYLDETRKYLYDKGIYDPTTKVFDEGDYDNLIKTRDELKLQLQQDPENQELKMLIDSFNKNTLPYDKPTTIKLFNSYVQNTPEQNQGTNNLALGLGNQMAEGGPIYTYDKRPGSYYQRAADGSWMISNAGTKNQYVPIDDPTGQRTALLNKHAVVYNAPVQGAPKITPAPIKTQQVAAQKNSPVLAEQKQYKQAQKEQKVFDSNQAKQQAYEQALAKTKLQSVQPADWVFAAPMVAPMALEAIGAAAATEIPFMGGTTLGTAANVAGGIHGATQVPQRIQDWQDVSSGNMDWKEAALKTGLTGLEVGAGALQMYPNIYRAFKPGINIQGGQAYKTVYPKPITNTQGYKSFGQTQYAGPVEVNRKFAGDLYSIKNVTNPQALPLEQHPFLYSPSQIANRFSPEEHAYFKMLDVEKTADKLIKRNIDDRVYYDLNGNIIKTPSDNY